MPNLQSLGPVLDRALSRHSLGQRPTKPQSTMKNSWYVSYESGLSTAGGHYRRQTNSFSCEEEAKDCAQTLVERGVRLTAGTINPVHPKRLLATEQEISDWLRCRSEGSFCRRPLVGTFPRFPGFQPDLRHLQCQSAFRKSTNAGTSHPGVLSAESIAETGNKLPSFCNKSKLGEISPSRFGMMRGSP